ncbi:hypothetical protein ABZP36_030965 [Zizania latifolia]
MWQGGEERPPASIINTTDPWRSWTRQIWPWRGPAAAGSQAAGAGRGEGRRRRRRRDLAAARAGGGGGSWPWRGVLWSVDEAVREEEVGEE